MSYVKKVWQTGDIITATDINHIENGISDLDSRVPVFGGLYLTVQNAPEEVDMGFGYIVKIQYNSTEEKYYVASDNLDEIYAIGSVTSQFFGWYILPPSGNNNNTFIAFIIPTDIYEYISESLTITGDMEISPVDVYNYSSSSVVDTRSANNDSIGKGYILHGIGNITIIAPEEYDDGGGTVSVA